MSALSYFRRSVVAFPLAALAALAMFVISEVSYQDATSALDSLGERATARNRLNQVAKSLLDAETGQRGYLLSNRQDYLTPYRDAQDGLIRLGVRAPGGEVKKLEFHVSEGGDSATARWTQPPGSTMELVTPHGTKFVPSVPCP